MVHIIHREIVSLQNPSAVGSGRKDNFFPHIFQEGILDMKDTSETLNIMYVTLFT